MCAWSHYPVQYDFSFEKRLQSPLHMLQADADCTQCSSKLSANAKVSSAFYHPSSPSLFSPPNACSSPPICSAVADGVCMAARTSAAPNNGSLVQAPSLSQRRAVIVFESYTCRSAATGPGARQLTELTPPQEASVFKYQN